MESTQYTRNVNKARNATTSNLRVAVELGRALQFQATADEARQLASILNSIARNHATPSSNQGRMLAALADGFEAEANTLLCERTASDVKANS